MSSAAPPIVEKPVIEFDRYYTVENGQRKHVIELTFEDKSYRSAIPVANKRDAPFEKIYKQFNRALNAFQREIQ